MKYKTKEAATAALAKLGGRELADFPGQTVRSRPLAAREPAALPALTLQCIPARQAPALPDGLVAHDSLHSPTQAARSGSCRLCMGAAAQLMRVT